MMVGLLFLLASLVMVVDVGGATIVPLYARHCAVCHGDAGRGNGPAIGTLYPRPRDFTTGVYKLRSTPSGTLPTIADVSHSIQVGLPGTSMPGYADLLSAKEIDDLARFLRRMAPLGARPGRPIPLGTALAAPASIERGRVLFGEAGCGGCHGLQGTPFPWRPAREDPGGPSRPTDLSEPWTFRGGNDRESVTRRILTGIDGSTMPPFDGRLAVPDAWAIASHVETLARIPIWQEGDPATIRAAGIRADPIDRGRYLVRATQCALCHTPISATDGAYDVSLYMAASFMHLAGIFDEIALSAGIGRVIDVDRHLMKPVPEFVEQGAGVVDADQGRLARPRFGEIVCSN